MSTDLLTRSSATARRAPTHVAIAFGVALSFSSSLGIAPAILDWTTTGSNPVSDHSGLGTSTSGARPVDSSTVPVHESAASALARLRAMTDLTFDQVARIMGVSRRSVHSWMAGGPLSSANEERVFEVSRVVASLRGSTAPERRAALLDSSQGESLLAQLTASARHATVVAKANSVSDRISL